MNKELELSIKLKELEEAYKIIKNATLFSLNDLSYVDDETLKTMKMMIAFGESWLAFERQKAESIAKIGKIEKELQMIIGMISKLRKEDKAQ